MHNRMIRQLVCAVGAVLGASALLALRWDVAVATGIVVGGLWNLASFWCLANLLQAWLGPKPSRRRAVTWLLIKFPLLYGVIFTVFISRAVSSIGFGIGFTVVLVVLLGWYVLRAPQMAAARSHGR